MSTELNNFLEAILLNHSVKNQKGFTSYLNHKGKIVNVKSLNKRYVIAYKTIITYSVKETITTDNNNSIKRYCDIEFNRYIGGWSYNDIYYIEYILLTNSLKDALNLGKIYNQKSIYDLCKKEEIVICQ